MINQQLIDFIKQSLQQGVTKEKITSDLIANRWTPTDINEGFASLNTPPVVTPTPIISPVSAASNASVVAEKNLSKPSVTVVNPTPIVSSISTFGNKPVIAEKNHLNKKFIFIIGGILFILALGASGYYFRNDLPFIKDLIKSDTTKVGELIQDQTNLEKTQTQQPEIPVVTETTPEQNLLNQIPTDISVATSNIVNTNTDQIDCGTTHIPASSELDKKVDDCMEKQFKSCFFSKKNLLVLDSNTNPFTEGPKTYYKGYLEILGYKDKLCLVKIGYITSQTPEWENKDMTCGYDTSKNLRDNNMYNSECSGSLYDSLQNFNSKTIVQ